jgi:AbrB family looped-hinge helix DNA binding protein
MLYKNKKYHFFKGVLPVEAIVTSKGQIVIPASLRKKYSIRPGTRIDSSDDGEHILLRSLTPEYVDSLMGFLKGGGAFKALVEDREFEKDRE